MESGEILRIDRYGKRTSCHFQMQSMPVPYACTYSSWYDRFMEDCYANDLKALSGQFGYSTEDVDNLLNEGVTPEEIEDWFYYYTEEV